MSSIVQVSPKNVCAIVEPREHAALEFVLCNFQKRLGWPMHIYHGTANKEFVQRIIEKNKALREHTIILHDLGVKNLTIKEYNQLMTNIQFYDSLGCDVEYVLIFQTDTMLFSTCTKTIDHFLEGKYDYIGGPWKWLDPYDKSYCGGNGGLSLRRVPRIKCLLSTFPFPQETVDNEDSHICRKPDTKLPPRQLAEHFSVESTFHPHPFGCHKPWIYWSIDEYLHFKQHEPEIDLLIAFNFIDGQKKSLSHVNRS